jgi:SAM-dependent methyltransferase
MATFGGRPLIDHDNLEDYADPVDYERRDSSDTGVAFYASLAQETGGPVLEITCSTGRVAIPIARQGFAVTGLDVVPGMLELARSKAAGLPIRWVEGDVRSFNLGEERFRLIFLTGNAFQAFLTNAGQGALLGRGRAHLHDEGLFRVRNPQPALAHPRGPGRGPRRPVYLPGDPRGGGAAAPHQRARARVEDARLRARRPGPEDHAHRLALHLPAGTRGAAALQRVRHRAAVRRLKRRAVDRCQPEHHSGLSQARLAARTPNRGRRATTGGAHANLGQPNLPAPAESRDALLRGHTGEQTGQESRSEGTEAQVDFCRRTE